MILDFEDSILDTCCVEHLRHQCSDLILRSSSWWVKAGVVVFGASYPNLSHTTVRDAFLVNLVLSQDNWYQKMSWPNCKVVVLETRPVDFAIVFYILFVGWQW